jgi:hypothetical protein
LLVVQENVAGSIWLALQLEFITSNLKQLGYPQYFQNILGFWQFLCAVAILVPGFGRIKEWAYAGAFFNYSSAVYSHVAIGHGPGKWMPPLVYAVLAVASWALRPPERRLVPAHDPKTSSARAWIVSAVVLGLLAVVSLLTLPKGPEGW